MVTMDASRLALLLLVYVTLDFANPLMPGAVRFDDGSVDVVHADRTRPVMPTPPADLASPSDIVIDPRAHVRAPDHPSSILQPRRRAVTRIRRSPLSSSEPSAVSEDH
jgi:hypothetical protein